MCFSAQASFLTSAVLVATGIACLLKASKPAHALLALVPLFFAVQQSAEGLLWTFIPLGSFPTLMRVASSLFIAIAAFGWPLLIPFVGQAVEENPYRRKILIFFIAVAILWTLIGGYQVITYGFSTALSSCHIVYTFHSPFIPSWLTSVYYCAAVLLPFFVASNRRFNLLGILTTVSCLMSFIFWRLSFVSVWCFFAAVISIGTYSVLISLEKGRTTT